MRKLFFILSLLLSIQSTYADTAAQNENNNISLVKNMFSNFAEKRDINTIDDYYNHDFVLISNNESFDYMSYKKQQSDIFKTLKNLKVIRYDDIFATDNKVVSRMVIQLINNDNKINTFYVILIALIKDHKIDRIWEITYPSWSDKLPSSN